MVPYTATLSLGSNLEDRYENLLQGMRYLLDHGMSFLDCSSVYETLPVGYTQQPLFLNLVMQVQTDLDPFPLLEVCQAAEKESKRERLIKWGPRTLDIDILFFDQRTIDLPELTIPHPRIAERAFVLGPLEDIDPGLLGTWKLSPKREGIEIFIPVWDVKYDLLK